MDILCIMAVIGTTPQLMAYLNIEVYASYADQTSEGQLAAR